MKVYCGASPKTGISQLESLLTLEIIVPYISLLERCKFHSNLGHLKGTPPPKFNSSSLGTQSRMLLEILLLMVQKSQTTTFWMSKTLWKMGYSPCK